MINNEMNFAHFVLMFNQLILLLSLHPVLTVQIVAQSLHDSSWNSNHPQRTTGTDEEVKMKILLVIALSCLLAFEVSNILLQLFSR